MAAIIRNEKEGKLVSFKFKACLGRDECGKQIFRCTTWHIPEDMSLTKAQNAAEKAAAEAAAKAAAEAPAEAPAAEVAE